MTKRAIYYSAVGLMALSLTGCGNEIATENSMEPVKVKTIRAKMTQVEQGRKYSGTIEENMGTDVSFATAGTVAQVLVNNGQQVTKGQLLATLDQTTLQSAHNASQSILKQAEDAYERMKKLHDANAISDMQWVEVQSKVEQARCSEQMARKALSDTQIFAPATGIVTNKSVETGQNVVPSVAVMMIVDIGKVKVKISVPEDEISQIGVGSWMGMTVKAVGRREYTGKIVEKEVTANPLTRTYNIRALVDNADHSLMPGMICESRIYAGQEIGEAMVLPLEAVQLSESNGHFVWKDVAGKARKQSVEVGEVTVTGVTILSGIEPDEKVIVEGQHKVSEGMEICDE